MSCCTEEGYEADAWACAVGQFVTSWRAEGEEDWHDACIAALLQMLVRACRALTTTALLRKQCQLLMLYVGHTDSAEHVLRSLLALPECRGDGYKVRDDGLTFVVSYELLMVDEGNALVFQRPACNISAQQVTI